jgi:hypothetical protein
MDEKKKFDILEDICDRKRMVDKILWTSVDEKETTSAIQAWAQLTSLEIKLLGKD